MSLRDLVVVETGVGIAVPLVSRVLTDLGTTTVKVESSGRQDFNRTRLRPPSLSQEDFDDIWPQIHDMSCGKLSATLNLKSEKGRELLLQLLERADVFVEN